MNGPAALLAFLAGTVLLFLFAIAGGLWSRRRFFAKAAREVNAAKLWQKFGAPQWSRDMLIYGVPTDFSMFLAGWIVRDGNDREVGRILGGGYGFEIDAGGERYRVRVLGTWRYRAELRRANDFGEDPAGAVCAFRATGGFGARTAEYSGGPLGTIAIPRALGWPRETYAILRGGAEVGRICILKPYRPLAKALILSGEATLAQRLFIFAVASGPGL